MGRPRRSRKSVQPATALSNRQLLAQAQRDADAHASSKAKKTPGPDRQPAWSFTTTVDLREPCPICHDTIKAWTTASTYLAPTQVYRLHSACATARNLRRL